MVSSSADGTILEVKRSIECDSSNYSCVYVKKDEKRPTKCLRCEHDFKVPAKLYNHLWNNKTDCNKDSKISIEEARKYANASDYYKCDYCEQVIVNKTEREKHQAICDHKELIDNLEVNGIDPIISYLFCSNDDGKIVSNIDKETGYINATLMCKSSGKQLCRFMDLDSTKELIKELEILKEKERLRHEVQYCTSSRITFQDNNKKELEILKEKESLRHEPGYPGSCFITFQDNNKKELEILKEKESFSITFQDSIIIQKPSFMNPKVKHTYVHELLAINLAQWCSAKYGLLVSQFIMKFRNGLIKTEDSVKAKEDVKDIMNGKLDSVTNYTNKYDPQVYFIGFDVNFKDLKAIYVNSKEKFNENDGFIIKYGNQKKNSTRQTAHKSSFDNYKLLDSIKCYDQDNLEKFVEEIISENRIKIIDPNKISGNEYIYFKTQEDYKDLIDKVIIKAEELNKAINDDLYGNNDIELKKLEIGLKQKELSIKEKEEETKQKEIELKKSDNEVKLRELALKEKEEETKQKEIELKKSDNEVKLRELALKEKELEYKYKNIDKSNKESIIVKENSKESIVKENNIPGKQVIKINNEPNKIKKPNEKYIGICIKKLNNNVRRYEARTSYDGKQIHLGTYENKEVAAYIYDSVKKYICNKNKIKSFAINNINKPDYEDIDDIIQNLIDTFVLNEE